MNKENYIEKIRNILFKISYITIGIIIIFILIIDNCSIGHACTGFFEVPVIFFILIFTIIGTKIITKILKKKDILIDALIFLFLSFLFSKIYTIYLYGKIVNYLFFS